MKLTDVAKPRLSQKNIAQVLRTALREFGIRHFEIVSWNDKTNIVTLNVNAPMSTYVLNIITQSVPFEIHLHRVDSFQASNQDFLRCANFPQSVFKFFPSEIQYSLYMKTTGRSCSLHGIYKYVKRIIDVGSHVIVESSTMPTHLLGLLLIKGNFQFGLIYRRAHDDTCVNIINHYLESDHDINACQEELIEAGFPEQAKL